MKKRRCDKCGSTVNMIADELRKHEEVLKELEKECAETLFCLDSMGRSPAGIDVLEKQVQFTLKEFLKRVAELKVKHGIKVT